MGSGVNVFSLSAQASVSNSPFKGDSHSQTFDYQSLADRINAWFVRRWEEFVAWTTQCREALAAWISPPAPEAPFLPADSLVHRRLIPFQSPPLPRDPAIENRASGVVYPLILRNRPTTRQIALSGLRAWSPDLGIFNQPGRPVLQVIRSLSRCSLSRVGIRPLAIQGQVLALRAIEQVPMPSIPQPRILPISKEHFLLTGSPMPWVCRLSSDRLSAFPRLLAPHAIEFAPGNFIRKYEQEFEYLRLLPQEMRAFVAAVFDKKYPPPSGHTWAELSVMDANAHPEMGSLPFFYFYLVDLLHHPLQRVHFFLDVDNYPIEDLLKDLRSACEKYLQWNGSFEVTPLHQLLMKLPYVGALEFISDTRGYHERNILFFNQGKTPSELAIIQAWLQRSLKEEVLSLSFALISERFNKFASDRDLIPSYLVPLLPFKSCDSWCEGMEDPKRVEQALEIVNELGKVDLCLRLPKRIVDPLLKQGGLLAHLIGQYQTMGAALSTSATGDSIQQPTKSQEKEGLQLKFPEVPSFLVPVILRGKSLEAVLNDPQRLSLALDLLRQIEFLELLTYLPAEIIDVWSEKHKFSPGHPWSDVLGASREMLKRQGGHTLTLRLAQEFFYLDSQSPLDLDELDLVRLGQSPTQLLLRARYLTHRIGEETTEKLEEGLETQGYLPLTVSEQELLQESIELALSMGETFGMAKAVIRGALLANKARNYLTSQQFNFNYNAFAWLHAFLQKSLAYFNSHSEEDRYRIYLKLHDLVPAVLDQAGIIPDKQKMVDKMQAYRVPEPEVIQQYIQRISPDLLNLFTRDSQSSSLKMTLKTVWAWLEKSTDHEVFSEPSIFYEYRALIHFLFPKGLDDTLCLDPIIVKDPATGEYRYHLKAILDFITQIAGRIAQQHLGRYEIYAGRYLDLNQLTQSFGPLHALLMRQEAISQAELVEAIPQIMENGIDYFVRLLTGGSALRSEEDSSIRMREERLNHLQQAQEALDREFEKDLASQDQIIAATSSWNLLRTFTALQKKQCAEAKQQRDRLIIERNKQLDRIAKETESLTKQIQMIQRHGIPEIFDIIAVGLGLPQSSV